MPHNVKLHCSLTTVTPPLPCLRNRGVLPHCAELHAHWCGLIWPLPSPGSTEPPDSAMEAFYYGRAFVQTLGDRMGAALGDFLAEAGKHDAERQQALRCVIPQPHPLVDLPPNAAWGVALQLPREAWTTTPRASRS